ncbi:hypothetical protein WJX73_005575 [Symbiochloris irregularis]|uniref:Transcription initiation factor TFIID subunit 12 domain-containing protein n=1 Tax=Symbiochloris irregularis TaxID=706552 RepID=A0AAW1P575_9CHLO
MSCALTVTMQPPTEAEMTARVHQYNATSRAAAGNQQRMVSLPPLAAPAHYASAHSQPPGGSMHNIPIRLNHALPNHVPAFDGRVVGVAPTPLGGRTFVSAQSSLPVPPAGMKLLSSKAVARLADGHEVEQKVLEPAVVQLAEAFVEAACAFGCSMARRRKGRRLEALDMADYLERNWQVRVPGFLAKEVRPFKRLRNTGHQQRKEAVQQLQAAAQPLTEAAQASKAPAAPTAAAAAAAAPALPAPADADADATAE